MLNPIEVEIGDVPALELREQLRMLETLFHKTLDDIAAVEEQYGPGKCNPLGSELCEGMPLIADVGLEGMITLARILGYTSSLMMAEIAIELDSIKLEKVA